MANSEHVALLKKSVAEWNAWRREHLDVWPDLKGANLEGADLREADLFGANLEGANLRGAHLIGADLRRANLSEANLSSAKLEGASLIETNLTQADLTGCRIYGVSAWTPTLTGATKKNLVITPDREDNEPTIQVDDLRVAQFIYLLLNNAEVRHVIDTITSKVILILGRFTEERKAVLDSIREELRKHDRVPVLFDFEKLHNQTTMETITTLAHMARFVIADLTDAKSVLQELQGIVPNNTSVPVQPLLLSGQGEPGMIDSLKPYPWFLEIVTYHHPDELLTSLAQK